MPLVVYSHIPKNNGRYETCTLHGNVSVLGDVYSLKMTGNDINNIANRYGDRLAFALFCFFVKCYGQLSLQSYYAQRM